jgi:uncharacterized protein (TIGR03067 family)
MTALVLALPLVLAAPVPKDFKKAATDLAVLQGEWEEVERNNYGSKSPQRGTRYLIEGNKLQILNGKGEPRVVTLTLDEKAKTYTWDAAWGQWHGRYKLDGDTFTRASAKKDKPLPDAVAPGKAAEFTIYKRVKK